MVVPTLSGNWLGIVGGTNIGHVDVRFNQQGNQLYGRFNFQDLVAVPVSADLTGMIDGEWIDGTLANIRAEGNPANISAKCSHPHRRAYYGPH